MPDDADPNNADVSMVLVLRRIELTPPANDEDEDGAVKELKETTLDKDGADSDFDELDEEMPACDIDGASEATTGLEKPELKDTGDDASPDEYVNVDMAGVAVAVAVLVRGELAGGIEYHVGTDGYKIVVVEGGKEIDEDKPAPEDVRGKGTVEVLNVNSDD